MSSVIVAELCPSICWTTLTSAPLAIARLAVADACEDQVAGGGSDPGQGRGAFDVREVDDDLATLVEGVEHLPDVADAVGSGAGAHGEGEVGVGGVGEPVHGVQVEHGGWGGPGGGVVEYSATADGGELMSIAEERDPGAGLVGEDE